MTITSTAVQANDHILPEYTCDGSDTSPPLTFSEVPIESKSLALIVDDPDAPGGTFTHWLLYNMSPGTLQVPEGGTPPAAVSGQNGFGKTGYGGPCPPSGTHHYRFKLFALDTELDLPEGAARPQLEDAINGHVIDQAELVGLYERVHES